MPALVTVKSILNKKKRRDPWFLDDYTINPYSGCSFNCLYCYIRGSKYGIHMERKLSVKEHLLEILEKQLASRAKKNQHGIIVLASATEPYLQVEKELGLTRKILELILKYRFPVHIITKSDLVARDFDLLREIDQQAIFPGDLSPSEHKVFITFSFSTLDDHMAHIFEPGATPPSVRLETFRKTLAEGFHSGVSLMPLLPFISDTDDVLTKMFEVFKEAGAHYIFPASITLFGSGVADSKTLMFKAIEAHFPHLLPDYQQLFSRGDYVPFQYRAALDKKTKALSLHYGLKNSIL